MRNRAKQLIALADKADQQGNRKEANRLDRLIKRAVFGGDKRTPKDMMASNIYEEDLRADRDEKEYLEDAAYWEDYDSFADYEPDDSDHLFFDEDIHGPSKSQFLSLQMNSNKKRIDAALQDPAINDREWIQNLIGDLNQRIDLMAESKSEAESKLPEEGDLIHFEEPEPESEPQDWPWRHTKDDLTAKYPRS